MRSYFPIIRTILKILDMEKFIQRKFLVVVFLVFPLFSQEALGGRKVAIVMSSNVKIYRLISEGILESLKLVGTKVIFGDSKKSVFVQLEAYQAEVVVAVGDTAAIWLANSGVASPVVVSGIVKQANPLMFRSMTGVSIDFSFQDYLKLIKESFPSIKRVGVLFNPEKQEAIVDELMEAADSLKVYVDAVPIRKENEIGEAMQSLEKRGTKILLLTYDPLIMNPETWQYLVGFALTHHMGLMVPSLSLLKNGGLLSLEADYRAVGKQTGGLVLEMLKDHNESHSAHLDSPSLKEIGFSVKTGKAIRMDISANVRKKIAHLVR
jgi:putative ABC transport system substrate-binding protein